MTQPQSLARATPLLILASRSPRRQELLKEAGYEFQVIASDEDVECGVCSETGPAGLVTELAYRKAAAVVRQLRGSATAARKAPAAHALVLAADTVAECDGFILGKPRDEAHARAMLAQLSGRDHRVLTGVCLWPATLPLPPAENSPWREGPGEDAPLVRAAVTKLRMDQLSEAQLDDYLASGQWQGKAGAFGYQDRLGWVHIVEGSPSNVVGLPLELLAEMIVEIHHRE